MVSERDVVYRRDGAREWHAQVYAPDTTDTTGVSGAADASDAVTASRSNDQSTAKADARPLLIDVHGGAWSGGNRFAGQSVDRLLVERLGIVVVAIDFRIAPDDPYPAMMQDLNYAIRWAKAHAAELGADAANVGAIGWSSGGHMAVLAGLRPDDPRYTALPLDGPPTIDARLGYVVACWPPLDPRARYRLARETGRGDLVRNTEGRFGDEDGMWEASAGGAVASGEATAQRPIRDVQGTADGNLPRAMTGRFAETYRKAGGEVGLDLHEAQGHGLMARPGRGVGETEAARRAREGVLE